MYQIVTDSSWDMGEERARSLGVAVVPFYVTYDGESFHREDSDQTVREMYQFMVDNPKIDELCDLARTTGVAGIQRTASTHALNIKGTIRMHCGRRRRRAMRREIRRPTWKATTPAGRSRSFPRSSAARQSATRTFPAKAFPVSQRRISLMPGL